MNDPCFRRNRGAILTALRRSSQSVKLRKIMAGEKNGGGRRLAAAADGMDRRYCSNSNIEIASDDEIPWGPQTLSQIACAQ